MTQHVQTLSDSFEVAFLILQAFVVAFLLFHDWIPLGRLNNLAAIQTKDTLQHRLFVTLLPAIPSAVGLLFSARYFCEPYPQWLDMLLWITYGLLFLGLLRAWWIPYLVRPDMERAARYQIIFANTHTFLPRRNGISPNTLHVLFHFATVATLVLLFMRDRMMSHV